MCSPASLSSSRSRGQTSMPPTASTTSATPPSPISTYLSIRMPVSSSIISVSSGTPPVAKAALILAGLPLMPYLSST